MNMTLLDHLLAFLLIVPLPLVGSWQLRRLKARVEAGVEEARLHQYRAIIVEEVLFVGVILASWWGLQRPLSTLAPEPPSASWWPLLGWGLTVAACVFLVVQSVLILRSGEGLAETRRQLRSFDAFLPRTPLELRTFWVLSLTAGVCEEVIYRGFAMAWLAGLFAGVSETAWIPVLGSSVMFGLAHSYQGGSGMLRTGIVGLAMAGLAVATGSLVAPMVVHTVLDVTSGTVAQRAVTETGGCRPTPSRTDSAGRRLTRRREARTASPPRPEPSSRRGPE